MPEFQNLALKKPNWQYPIKGVAPWTVELSCRGLKT